MGRKLKKVRISMGLVSMAARLSEFKDRLKGEPGAFNRDKYTEFKQPGWVADVEKAAAMLSFRPRYTLEEAIKETIDWYTEEKWL